MSDQLQDALSRLHNELKRLEPAVDHIENARIITAKVGELPALFEQQRLSIEQTYADKLRKFEEKLATVTEEQKHYLQDTISAFKIEIEELGKYSMGMIQAIQIELEDIQELKVEIRTYYEAILKIDFPTRLDKLDATVSGIMAATQTTQGRVDNLERTTLEKFGVLSSQNEKANRALTERLETENKAMRALLIVTIVIACCSLGATVFLLIRS